MTNQATMHTAAEVGDKVSCSCKCHLGQRGEITVIGQHYATIKLNSGAIICLPHADYEPLAISAS